MQRSKSAAASYSNRGRQSLGQLAVDVVLRPSPKLNEAPVIASVAAISVDEGQGIDITFTATDAQGDVPTFRLTADAPSGAVIDAATGRFTRTAGEEDGGRTHVIRIEAVDGRDANLIDYQNLFVTVRELNTPPVIDLPDSIDVAIGSKIALTVEITDADVPETFKEYRLVGDVPEEASIHPLSGEFSWQPMMEGEFEITFQVIDYLHPLAYLCWLEQEQRKLSERSRRQRWRRLDELLSKRKCCDHGSVGGQEAAQNACALNDAFLK